MLKVFEAYDCEPLVHSVLSTDFDSGAKHEHHPV